MRRGCRRARPGPAKSASAAPSRGPTPRGRGGLRDVRRVRHHDDRSHQVAGGARRTSRPSATRTLVAARPMPARLARATSRASALRSVHHTSTGERQLVRRATGRSHPSRCRGRRPRPTGLLCRPGDHLGLGARDQDPPIHHQVEGRNDHRPSTYCSGSPASRATMRRGATTIRGDRLRRAPRSSSAVEPLATSQIQRASGGSSRRSAVPHRARHVTVSDGVGVAATSDSRRPRLELAGPLVGDERVDHVVELAGQSTCRACRS
jgi:hypothetical protein